MVTEVSDKEKSSSHKICHGVQEKINADVIVAFGRPRTATAASTRAKHPNQHSVLVFLLQGHNAPIHLR